MNENIRFQKKLKRNSLCIFIFCFLLAHVPAHADDPDFLALQSLGVFHDTLWLCNSDNDSAPSPILSVWGASARFGLRDRWSLAPELGFTRVEYLFRDGKAFPAEIEEADAVRTLNIILGLPVLYRFQPADDFSIFTGVGPTFSFKLPYKTYGEASAGDVGGYFVKNARFFHLEICTAFEWDLFEHLGFIARARMIFPLYRLWDGDKLPIYDGLMAGVSFGLRLKL